MSETKKTRAISTPGKPTKMESVPPAAPEFAITCHVAPHPAAPGAFGSAILIDPHFALTAAHNLFHITRFDSVMVSPGHIGDNKPLWPKVLSTTFAHHERFNAENLAFDVGLIYFAKPFTHAFKFAAPVDTGARVGESVRVLGYRTKPTPGLYEHPSSCSGHEPGRIFYNANTTRGQSGGPLFAGTSLNLVGIHTYGSDRTPERLKPAVSATLLRKDLIEWINNQKAVLRGK